MKNSDQENVEQLSGPPQPNSEEKREPIFGPAFPEFLGYLVCCIIIFFAADYFGLGPVDPPVFPLDNDPKVASLPTSSEDE